MPDELLLSALNHFLFCERRAALIHVEGIFRQNVFTVEGTLHHKSADTPGYETQPGARVLRALPVFSIAFSLSGQADIVEFRRGVPYPVEYKRGKRRAWDNDDVQLCGQALCLEEMFHCEVPCGAIFHASSRRRREVKFTPQLRNQTVECIDSMRMLMKQRQLPKASLRPQCEGCSLRPDCLPDIENQRFTRAAASLFHPQD